MEKGNLWWSLKLNCNNFHSTFPWRDALTQLEILHQTIVSVERFSGTYIVYAALAVTKGNVEKLWANVTKTGGKNNLGLWWHTKAAGSCSTLQILTGRQAADYVTRSSFIISSGPFWAYASPGLEVTANPLGCLASASQRRCSRNIATALHILFWFGWFIVL